MSKVRYSRTTRPLVHRTPRASRVKLDLTGFADTNLSNIRKQPVENRRPASNPSPKPAPQNERVIRPERFNAIPPRELMVANPPIPPVSSVSVDRNIAQSVPPQKPGVVLQAAPNQPAPSQTETNIEPKETPRPKSETPMSGIAVKRAGLSHIVLIATATNAGLILLLMVVLTVYLFSQPKAINVFNTPYPQAHMAQYDQYTQQPVYAQSATAPRLVRDAPTKAPTPRASENVLTESVGSVMRDSHSNQAQTDPLLIAFLASELAQSRRRDAHNHAKREAEREKKKSVIQKQITARERARNELRSVYNSEISRLETLQEKGLIDRASVDKVRREALREDVELQDSLIVAMASTEATPELIPSLPTARFKAPHGHDFVAKDPIPLPKLGPHPSQKKAN